jgi:putative glutamine amidotransferase
MSQDPAPSAERPLVGISTCTSMVGLHRFHMTGDKYIQATRACADASPVLLPALGEDATQMLPHLDGLLFTGSHSNIEPQRYGAEVPSDARQSDPLRDETTLALIRQAVAQRIPVLGICRGFQEINVALGGTLHQAVHDVDGLQDHREDKQQSLEQQYATCHPVHLSATGLLAGLMNAALVQQVNSLHGQGVARLAPGLRIEALAADGLVEAFSLPENAGFLLGVQWHPEWQCTQHAFYRAIFAAFGQACRARAAARKSHCNEAAIVPQAI